MNFFSPRYYETFYDNIYNIEKKTYFYDYYENLKPR
jgi:hypothetical protein